MSQQIIETRLIPFPIQKGIGPPVHISPSGTMYYDSLYGITYQNIDGVNTWNAFATGGNTFTGGTVTGPTNFLSDVTIPNLIVDTITDVDYIDFNTGTTNPSFFGGRVFFDNTSKALSYYDVTSTNVSIGMGQQLYTRVYNATGTQIDKGKVIAITGTSNGLPSATLAINQHAITSARPIGLAAENIPNNSEGLVLNNGILSGITLNTFANGDTLYLSDTVAGGYISSTSSLAFTARTNEIGYVLQTGSTTGKIYVNINNEDSNLSLTDKERNILEGNVISGGVYEYTGITQGTSSTINVSMARGWIVRNTYSFATLPDVTNVYYTGGTNIPLTNLATADATFILINSASTLVQQTTFPTAQQRRENIYLGKVVHPNRTTIQSINQTVDFDVSPMAAIRDLWTPLKLINQGIIVSPHSTNLEIATSAGILWGNGIGWITNQQNPDSISISGTSPTTFQYRTQLGPLTGGSVTTGNTTTIAPGYYDLNGVVTSVGGGANSSTNQRVFLFPTGLVRIQLGQKVYGTLAEAVAGSQTEQFTEYALNRENGILIGIISVNKNATNLSLAAQAVFNLVSKFGEVLGGTGGLSTTTLQQAYDNSTTPEIVINSALDGLTIQNGTGNPDATTHLLEGQNAADTTTSFITAAGGFSGSSVSATTYHGLPLYGTSNYIPKWTGSTALADSIIYDTGTNIGIGETSPEGKLHVKNGSAGSVTALTNSTVVIENSTTNYLSMVSPDASPSGIVFGSPSDNFGAFLRWTYSTGVMEFSTANAGDYITFGTGNFVESMRLNSTGLGIGTTSIGDKLHVSGTTRLSGNLSVFGDTTISGTTFLGNGTFTKAGNATGDILLDNNATDTPGILFYYANNSNYGIDSWNGSYDVLSGQLFRVTNKLNETGGAVKIAVDTSGNMVVGGFVKPNAWRAGQVINDIILSNSEVTVSTTTIATSTSDTDFVTYSYTPLSSTSYLVIHYHLANYDFSSGTGNDSYISRIKVDGGEITYSTQSTVNGNRSGVLFPLMGRYTNSNTAAKSIVVACRRNSADDSITITDSSTSMWLRITEIAR